MAKIATIKNFSNMEESGVYYLEGMVARKINGKSILTPGYLNSFVLSENTATYTNLATVRNGVSFKQTTANSGSILMLDSGGYIHEYNITTPANKQGQIHSVASPVSMSDIEVTKNENLIYSVLDYLAVGKRGTATSGSTTTLVDTTTNFVTRGVVVGHKIWNFDDEEEYTVTSITTTTNTNDTLNFSAGTAWSNGKVYCVFADKGSYNGGTFFNFFATTTYPQFVGQEPKANFRRQIELFDTKYLVGNGKYLASMNVDEVTWDDNYKELPDNTQFQCMAKNQDRLLVGGVRRGKGVLLLWDGYSDGWLAIEELEQVPTCIKPYSAGWLVVIGNAVYYSNGFQTKLITKFPDTDDLDGEINTFYNSMLVVNDRMILAVDTDDYFRSKNGLWIYEFGSGWTITPYTNNSGTPLRQFNTGAVFSVIDYPDNPRTRKIYTSFGSASLGTNKNCLSQLIDRVANQYSVMFYVNLPKKVNISEIRLNISPQYDASDAYGTVVMDLAVGEGKHQLWRQSFCGSSSTTTSIKNTSAGTTNQAGIVGHQIRILEGDNAGERSYVTAISSAGTSSEDLTISPALSNTPANGDDFNMIALKHADQKSFTGSSIPDEILFVVEGFYSDKLFFEVYFNTTSSTRIDIHSIDIHGE